MKNRLLKYGLIFLGIISIIGFSFFGKIIYKSLEKGHEHELMVSFFVIAVLFVLSFFVFYLSNLLKLPSFVIAILLGLIAKPLLVPIASNNEMLGVIVGLGATLILFSGGLEIPFANFKRLILKIFSLSFIGLFLTSFLFSCLVWFLNILFGFNVSIFTAVLLGAILASTDPAAIIPILKSLRFKNSSVKHIIISESAVTDVIGTLFTVIFLAMAISGSNLSSISSWYAAVVTDKASLFMLLEQLLFGMILGVLGYFFLEFLMKFKHLYEQEFEVDSAFFIAVPIIIFTGALFLGGSGYLAAFVAGLIFHLTEHLHETEIFFNNLVDGFLKPIIFILLGALVDIPSLIEYLPIGILSALVFMVVIRPLVVFISLGGFIFVGKEKISIKDLLFISFVRETGAIPAVLMLTVVSSGIGGVNGLVEIGMWTILLTLSIQPLFTPYVAKLLGVAEVMTDASLPDLSTNTKVLLTTRGGSYYRRMPFVVEWAIDHNIEEVVVLLCLEDRYTPELEEDIKNKAYKRFEEIVKDLKLEGKNREVHFKMMSRKGLLHEKIKIFISVDKKISVIFAGKGMLDYRLNEIKKIPVPFYFID